MSYPTHVFLVTGSRHLKDGFVANRLNFALRTFFPKVTLDRIAVIHGAAPGADALAEKWALTQRIRTIPHPADWTALGEGAGPVRNQQMVDLAMKMANATGCEVQGIAFWDGRVERCGTFDCMKRMQEAGIPCFTQPVRRKTP